MQTRKARETAGFFLLEKSVESALTSLHARVFLVNNIDAPFATDDFAIFITQFGGLQGITNFHNTILKLNFLLMKIGDNTKIVGYCQ